MNANIEVPQIQIAKAGERRERRGAGALFFLGSWGSRTALIAVLGAAATMTTLIVGSYNAGKSALPHPLSAPGKALFSAKKTAGASGAASAAFSQPSGLAFVTGSLGKTREQVLTEEAAAASAAKAEADKKANADMLAGARSGEADASPASGDGQAAGAAAQAAAETLRKGAAGGAFGSRFGQMSGGLDGGRSSAASGVALAAGSALSGGPGLSGGVGRAFDKRALGGGLKKFAMPKAATRASVRRVNGANRGRAFNQLRNASTLSRQAKQAAMTETAATTASLPFDNNASRAEVLTGAGAKAGASASDAGPAASSGSDGTSSGSVSSDDATETEETTTTSEAASTDATPWKNDLKTAINLLLLASVLLLAAAALSLLGNAIPWAKTAAQVLGGLAALLGLVVAMLGSSIMGMGADRQGGMFLASGLIVAVAGGIVVVNPTAGSAGSTTALSTIATWSAAIGGILGGGIGLSGMMADDQ